MGGPRDEQRPPTETGPPASGGASPSSAGWSHADAHAEAEGFAQMSHELRTLLSGIIGMSGLLLESQLSAEQREHVRSIRSSGDAIVAILNDIVDFGKTGAGAPRLDLVDFDLRRTVEDVGEALAERAHDGGTELVVVVRPEVPGRARGAAARIRQVLLNVVGHAIRAAPRGEVAVRAALARRAPGSARAGRSSATRVRFEVRFAAGAHVQPAEAAAPADKAVASKEPATGAGGAALSLVVARRLVVAMGGELGSARDAGGSVLWFELPVERRGRAPDRATIPRPDLSGKRALVVDDSGAAREAVMAMAEELGVACAGAGSLAAGMSALREGARRGEPFDVVLADAALPAGGGAGLSKRIDADEALAATRIVWMVGAAQGGKGSAGAASELRKPVRRSQIHAALQAALGAGEAAPGARAAEAGKEPTQVAEPQGDRPRVLVVEDNLINQKVAAFLVEKHGCQVDVVDGGEAAVEAVRRGRYAAVLMDCQMPRFDGYEATAAIRTMEGRARRIPIIAMTANVGPGAREKCLAAGMDDYLSKPLRHEELERVLRAWCDRSHAAARSEAEAGAASATAAPARAAAETGARSEPEGGASEAPARPERGSEASEQPARPEPPTWPSETSDKDKGDKGKRRGSLSEAPAHSERRPAARGHKPGAEEAPARSERPALVQMVAEVMGFFRSDAPARVAEMRDALSRGAMDAVRDLARGLHEGAMRLEAIHLKELSAELERQAAAGTPEAAAATVEGIAREIDRMQRSLDSGPGRRGR